ncbi:hypothetical protein [Rossellomorea sp. BNER]|uniref:hypothetical protein n=1 Tax=Rossellomorea sp. BNER TaxID=2962031 RepID=UPI003AF1ECBF|nr:hypothetical protein [Rossellomorea sp. BNER]
MRISKESIEVVKNKNDLPVQGASAFQLSSFSASRHNLSLLERKTAAFLTGSKRHTAYHLNLENYLMQKKLWYDVGSVKTIDLVGENSDFRI